MPDVAVLVADLSDVVNKPRHAAARFGIREATAFLKLEERPFHERLKLLIFVTIERLLVEKVQRELRDTLDQRLAGLNRDIWLFVNVAFHKVQVAVVVF